MTTRTVAICSRSHQERESARLRRALAKADVSVPTRRRGSPGWALVYDYSVPGFANPRMTVCWMGSIARGPGFGETDAVREVLRALGYRILAEHAWSFDVRVPATKEDFELDDTAIDG